MKLTGQRTVLIGASGGIGRPVARELAAAGARLALVDRSVAPLEALRQELQKGGAECVTIVADITRAEGRQRIVEAVTEYMGGVDLLVNTAGMLLFGRFAAQDEETIERLYQVNLVAPVLLTRAFLPAMVATGHGHVALVGSVLGTLGLPFYANYVASKFGLRGFAEALRRELAGSGVAVTYVAPRTTRTAINSDAVYRMGEEMGMRVDEPEAVARVIVRAIIGRRREVYLGWPEGLFARLNSLWPALLDRGLGRQTAVMRRYVDEAGERG
jgi:short-subunit dehydrogenase